MNPFDTIIDDSLKPLFSADRIVEEFLRLSDGLKVEDVFIRFMESCYGVLLDDCWIKDAQGTEYQIQRIFHFEGVETLPPPEQPSWRGHVGDLRLDYSVPYLESCYPNWEELDAIVPFAGLDCEEAAQFDMLCLDYRQGGRPGVVVWRAEESAGAESVVTIPVAESFEAFMAKAYRRRSD